MAQDRKQQKFETWKHGLLDVSKRNRMINYRKTKRATLKILSPDFCALFDRLVHRDESIPFKVRVDCSRDAQITRLFYLMDRVGTPVEVTEGEIDTEFSVDESNRTLKQLRAKSKLSLEEQGINILYLSFGFLEWKQKPTDNEMLAPLVLVPVSLTLESYGSPYVMSRLDEDIVVNPTLAYVLSSDFGIELPDFDAAKDDIGDYLDQVGRLVAPLGWQVQKEANLGLLSFLKIVMYRDLEKYKDRIFENPVISAFCGDASRLPQWDPGLSGYPHDRDSALDTWQVVNADSSQQDAIRLSKKGYSFVLQGPPGTGKSQTITNIIAEGLADGKKILFVSEKMAALSVVYHRLQEVNLSEYCLSLHNYKADKKKVIAELADSLDAHRQSLKSGVLDFVPEYEQQRKELDDYFAALKQERAPLNRTLYDVLTELCGLEEVSLFHITDSVLEIIGEEYQAKLLSLQKYQDFLAQYTGDIQKNPWRTTSIAVVTFDLKQSVEQLLGDMSVAMLGICSLLDLLSQDYGIGDTWSWKDYSGFIQRVAYAKTLRAFSLKVQNYFSQIFVRELEPADVSDLLARMDAARESLESKGYLSGTLDSEEQRQEECGKLRDKLEQVNTVCSFMKEFNQRFQTEFVLDRAGLGRQLAFLEAAMLCDETDPAWLERDRYDLAKSALAQMKSLRDSVYTADQTVQNFFQAPAAMAWGSISECKDAYDTLQMKVQPLESAWETARQEAESSGLRPETWEQISELSAKLGSEVGRLEQVFAFVDGVSRDIRMEYRTEWDGLDRIRLISQILMIPYNFRLEWVTGGNIGAVLRLAGEMEQLSEQLRRLSVQLLADWEVEFLSFDCSEIYSRFKVDYSSFLKKIGGQYKQDKRTMLAMKRNAGKKLEDSECIAGLETLRMYQNVKAQFDRKSGEAAAVFGGYYRGTDTDWKLVREVLNRCQPLYEYYEKYGMNPGLAEFLGSSCGVRRYAKLNGVWAEELASGERIREYSSYLDPYRNANLAEVIAARKRQVQILSAMNEVRISLQGILATEEPWCKCERQAFFEEGASVAGMSGFFAGVKAVGEELAAYGNAADSAKAVFPVHDRGIDTDWDYVGSCMDSAERLLWYASNVPLTAEMISALQMPPEERQKISLCGSPVSDWTDEEHVAALQSIWEEAGCSAVDSKEHGCSMVDLKGLGCSTVHLESPECPADQMALKIGSCILTIEDYDAVARKAASLFQHPENFKTLREMTAALRNYSEVREFLHEQQENAEKSFRNTGIENFSEAGKELFALLEEYMEHVEDATNNAFESFTGDRTSCRNSLNEASMGSRVTLPEEDALRRFDDLFREDMLSIPLRELSDRSQACTNMEELDSWLNYSILRQDCQSHDLGSYLIYMEGKNSSEDLLPVYRKSFLTRWVLEWLNTDELQGIRLFQSYSHENLIQSFRRNDKKMLTVNQARLNAKLSSEKPSGHSLSLNGKDEISTLRRENEKKRKVMPLRRLFKEIPILLQKLKPCFMMSPLSVSYFLDSEVYEFDMVIFDEASQILPEDAVGAIYRGRQVIIAGDTKQMPPTNFFTASARNEDKYDSDEDEDDEDFYNVVSESILDEANQSLPTGCTLLWHYRSKDESLIAFSNREIYGNHLTTFPNCRKEADKGLEYFYVRNGYYEGGGKNCNVEEAKRCVELVEEHIRRHPDRSLGIIAFSEKQQGVISNAVQEWRLKNPQYEDFFQEDREEPFFVKNLETVQGDERDTIIFSICYARNKDGKMHMRFGPLGQAGGERRLNVAITRAKYNVKLVGSIYPNDILLKENSKEGVRLLHDYIAYAMQNDYGLPEGEDTTDAPDQFPNQIGDFLEENGYQIRQNIGESQYKVDIAVLHPSLPDTYIAGIECDGENYSAARTARDRDYLRQDMMKAIGWNLYHVWSLAWYKNPETEKKRLLKFLDEVLQASSPDAAQRRPALQQDSPEDEIPEDISLLTTEEEVTIDDRELRFQQYEVSSPMMIQNAAKVSVGNAILYVLRHEQPIHMELLYKRLAPVFGKQKVTEIVRRYVDLSLNGTLRNRISIVNGFISLNDFGEIKARAQSGDERPIEYICPEEIQDAMITIVKFAYGIDLEDLYTETARVFGFTRRGAKITGILKSNFEELKNADILRMSDEKVYMGGGTDK
ncbi:MAG: DUF4011 domain-containing protein [Lachnospiraceae bacterium]|nr:DUF4011 domain-containing protein [Lachnospiraceae bacterium]